MKQANSRQMQCEVAVIGAGAAGIAAAIAAAEAGAKVVLVERYGFTGGLATSAMVGTVCGLYYRHLSNPRYAVRGFARQFAEQLAKQSNTAPAMFAGGLHFLPYQPSAFHQLAVQLLKQAGVQLLLHAHLTDVELDDGRIVALALQAAGQCVQLSAGAVVDCSGSAQVSMVANLAKIEEAHYQAGAFVFQLAGLPQMAPRLLALNMLRWIKRGIQQGDLAPQCAPLSFVPGTIKQGVGLLKLGMTELFDGSIECLTRYELAARTLSVAIVDYLRDGEPLLKNIIISAMANEVGVRTMSRSQGMQLLNEADILNCHKPRDGVAIGAWPIELWGVECKPEMLYFALDECYWIPVGALVSPHVNNLFFAGRALSATERAIASARVIGTCLSTGYAAGMLAAESVHNGDWQSAIAKIQMQQVFSVES